VSLLRVLLLVELTRQHREIEQKTEASTDKQ
jgi:hypothetical protein